MALGNMAAVSDDMEIDAVDEKDIPVGVVKRREVFREHANFRVAHDLIFNQGGEILIQRIAKNRIRHPGYWGSSVAAYIFAGESYEHAASRRLAQELGVHGVPLNYVGKTSMQDEGCRKFIGVFSATHDGPFSFDPSHIEALEFLPPASIHKLHASGARSFTPTFLRVLQFYQDRM